MEDSSYVKEASTGAEVDTGTDNAKYVTPLAMEDSSYVKDQYYGVYSYYDENEDSNNVTGTFSGDITLGGAAADLHAQRMGRMVMLTGRLTIDALSSVSGMPNDLTCGVDWDITTTLAALGVTDIQGGYGSGICVPSGGGADHSGFAVTVVGNNASNTISFESAHCQSFAFATNFTTSVPTEATFAFSIMLDVN